MKTLSTLLAAILLCAGGVCGCTVKQKEDPEKILRGSVGAASHITFQGIQCFDQQRGKQFFRFRMKIAHRAPDLTRLEFLEPPAKKGQIIIKQGPHSWKLGNGNKGPVQFKRFGSHRPMEIRNLDLLLKNYRLRHLGVDQVAQRPANLIEILSRWRPDIHRLVWVDQVNGLPLKSEETSGGDERPAMRFTYEEIEFPEDLPANLFDVPSQRGSRTALPRLRRKTLTLENALQIVAFTIALPRHLPKGFVLQKICWVEHPAPEGSPRGFLHFDYSDGLKAISLFEEDKESDHPADTTAAQENAAEADKIYRMREGSTTILHRHWGGTQATLVGETDPDDLLKMISSLENARD